MKSFKTETIQKGDLIIRPTFSNTTVRIIIVDNPVCKTPFCYRFRRAISILRGNKVTHSCLIRTSKAKSLGGYLLNLE